MELLSDYDYELPENLIAQSPLKNRTDSRLLVLQEKDLSPQHKNFSEILNFLKSGDALVINKSMVMKARLFGEKLTGGTVEILLVRVYRDNAWICLVRAKGKKQGLKIKLNGSVATIIGIAPDDPGAFIVDFDGDIEQVVEKNGEIPLPTYIERPNCEEDSERYQTVYADSESKNSVAAPTAGLHFDEPLLEKIKAKGVSIIPIVLHVGPGTFSPVREENIALHKMHGEMAEICEEAALQINAIKANGGRVVCVGTTSVRTLESFAGDDGKVKPGRQLTRLYIRPGFKFRIVDAMVTNFHLPKSTLLMLISAFCGRERVLKAYQKAIENQYRFFSYGDACFFEKWNSQ